MLVGSRLSKHVFPSKQFEFDFNFVNYLNDRKLVSKYIYMIVNEVVPWKISNSKIVTIFTMEAKCVVCCEATDEA